jgi:RNA polymerase sigma-70 factor (ECF subfamily)
MAQTGSRQPSSAAGRTDTPRGSGAGSVRADDEPVTISDETLVDRLRNGDPVAGEALCKRYAPSLLRYLQRLAGDSTAEELHQQTWLSVLDNLEKFEPGTAGSAGGFKAWLFRIATNKANDHWRSRGREKAAKEGLKLVTDDELPHAGHRIECTEQEQKLRQAIEQLPEAQRQVLMLRYYSNMKFVDIAAMLGCPLNTALGRVHKAMIKLRQMMDE